MYLITIFNPVGEKVDTVTLNDYPTARDLELVLVGREDHWLDVSRLPADVRDYEREREYVG